MKKLTLEQKAKRYDYLEKSIINMLEKKIADKNYDGEEMRDIDVVDEWIDKVDFNADIIPHELYLIFDKICDENYGDYYSIKNIHVDSYKQEYKQFEEKIGG